MRIELKELNHHQSIHFNQFLLKQLELTQCRKILNLYRGDNLQNLFNKLNVFYSSNEPDYEQLLTKLYMVGEKGKHFYEDQLFDRTRRIKSKIDDNDEQIFKDIFDDFNSSIKSKKIKTKSFFEKNPNANAYFLDKRLNKKRFVNAAMSVPKKERYNFRNFYLTLLHQLGAINYRDKSHFVSTSTNSEVAEKFACTNIGQKK